MKKFIYIVTLTPPDDVEDLDMEEVQRFGRMINIAVAGASADCRLHAELDMVPVGLPG